MYIATLRLAPRVPYKVAMAQFPNVEKAVDAVQEILTSTYGMNMRQSALSWLVESVSDVALRSRVRRAS